MLDALFGLTITSTRACKVCGHTWSSQDSTENLGITLTRGDNSTLGQLLRNKAVFGQETLTVTCPNLDCGKNQDLVNRRSITAAPEILVVHLRRFEIEFVPGQHPRHRKLNEAHSFPRILKLSSYSTERLEYVLKAVIHHGGSVNAGHYICYGQGPNDEWSEINNLDSSQSCIQAARSNDEEGEWK